MQKKLYPTSRPVLHFCFKKIITRAQSKLSCCVKVTNPCASTSSKSSRKVMVKSPYFRRCNTKAESTVVKLSLCFNGYCYFIQIKKSLRRAVIPKQGVKQHDLNTWPIRNSVQMSSYPQDVAFYQQISASENLCMFPRSVVYFLCSPPQLSLCFSFCLSVFLGVYI